jgi:hypothetical protein
MFWMARVDLGVIPVTYKRKTYFSFNDFLRTLSNDLVESLTFFCFMTYLLKWPRFFSSPGTKVKSYQDTQGV